MNKLFNYVMLLLVFFVLWRAPAHLEIVLSGKVSDLEIEHMKILFKSFYCIIALLVFNFFVLGPLIHFFRDITKK